uniref:Uncharacterized protein n=1 Tax=viral metagenome TaxID=1070528 RepID=A0A6C0LIX5_9ZZZZ
MNAEKLAKALDNDNNEQILTLTLSKIKEMNMSVLKELHLSKADTLELLKKLNGYKYVDELDDLKYGTYIRWVDLKDPNVIQLEKGAIFCETRVADWGISLVCKNFGFRTKYFQFPLDDHLVFQKLTDQENIILAALEHLNK